MTHDSERTTLNAGEPRRAALGLTRGDTVGRYRLVQTLGEGGMGVVWRAEQNEPVRREVAVKVIKPGMDSRAVLARFEAERQALAVMDHPCIATVLDGGATEGGLPYFAMEYVRGVPITEHCDRHRLSLTDRIELFIRVCDAVQHAHSKGVIHRDLKPGNILVEYENGRSTPKVIDFGVAKALNQRLTEATMFTEQGQMIGTPEYMSPEQAEMSAQDIDTRSDVYSLGVVLYELLAGARPFDAGSLRGVGVAEFQRVIREQEPPRPSTRLGSLASGGDARVGSGIAAARRTELRSLTVTLRRDLDWIVMRCLEKDRERRYETANALVMELGRFLNDEPVLAGPPSTAYRVRKFIKRNRTGVVSAAVVGASMLLATGVSVAFAVIADRQRARAETLLGERDAALAEEQERAEELRRVAEFQERQLADVDAVAMGVGLRAGLRERLLAAAQRRGLSGAEAERILADYDRMVVGADFTGLALEAMEASVFVPALELLDEQFEEQPLLRARLLQAVASTMRGVGVMDLPTDAQRRALEVRSELLGDEHADTLLSMNEWGVLLGEQGRLEESEEVLRSAMPTARLVLGADHETTINLISNLGVILVDRGRYDEAETFLREAMEGFQRVLGSDHGRTAVAMNDVGMLLRARGDLPGAEALLRESVAIGRRAGGDDHADTLASLNNLGLVLKDRDRLSEADACYSEVLETRRRVLGDIHPRTLMSMSNMGALRRSQGRPAEAEPLYREALAGMRGTLGDEHPDTLIAMNNLAYLLRTMERFDDAEPYFREVVTTGERVLGESHPITLGSMTNLALVLSSLGEFEEAASLGAETVRRGRAERGDDHYVVGIYRASYAKTLAAMGRFANAESEAVAAYVVLEASLGAAHSRTVDVARQLAGLYAAWHEAEPGAGHDTSAAEWRAKLPGEDDDER